MPEYWGKYAVEYYRISQRTDLGNIIRPTFLSQTQIWSADKPIFVKGVVDRGKEKINFLPLYVLGAFLISSEVRMIWEHYQKGGRYRSCAFGSVEQKQIRVYSYMMPRLLECVHPDTVYRRSGEIENLCMDRMKIGVNKIFGIRDEFDIKLIISGDVLEEMLRNNITAFQWEEVRVK